MDGNAVGWGGNVVYFVQARVGGPIKIGVTGDLPGRLFDLQTASPFDLRVLCLMRGGVAEEAGLHRRFAGRCVHGEWFDQQDPELGRLIELLGGRIFGEGRSESFAPSRTIASLRLSRWLTVAGSTSAQLAKQLRMSPKGVAVSKWASGITIPPRVDRARIERITGVGSLLWAFFEDDRWDVARAWLT